MASAEPPSSQQEASTQNSYQRHVRAKTDIAWGHCKMIQETGKTALLCIHCNKIIRGGGINRFKCHLAGEKGQVEQCMKVTADIRFQMKQSIDECKNMKRKTEEGIEDNYAPTEEEVAIEVVQSATSATPIVANSSNNQRIALSSETRQLSLQRGYHLCSLPTSCESIDSHGIVSKVVKHLDGPLPYVILNSANFTVYAVKSAQHGQRRVMP